MAKMTYGNPTMYIRKDNDSPWEKINGIGYTEEAEFGGDVFNRSVSAYATNTLASQLSANATTTDAMAESLKKVQESLQSLSARMSDLEVLPKCSPSIRAELKTLQYTRET